MNGGRSQRKPWQQLLDLSGGKNDILAISSETDRAKEAISNTELEIIVNVAKGEKGFYELSVQDKIKKLQSIRFALFGKHGIPFDWEEKLAEHKCLDFNQR